jgi:hypothetical protein
MCFSKKSFRWGRLFTLGGKVHLLDASNTAFFKQKYTTSTHLAFEMIVIPFHAKGGAGTA